MLGAYVWCDTVFSVRRILHLSRFGYFLDGFAHKQRSPPAREIDGGVWRASGHTTDEQNVLGRTTSIGFEKAKHSLRDENEGVDASRHAIRRSAMIVSHSSFRSESQALRAEAGCKVTENAADKAATEAARAAKLAFKVQKGRGASHNE